MGDAKIDTAGAYKTLVKVSGMPSVTIHYRPLRTRSKYYAQYNDNTDKYESVYVTEVTQFPLLEIRDKNGSVIGQYQYDELPTTTYYTGGSGDYYTLRNATPGEIDAEGSSLMLQANEISITQGTKTRKTGTFLVAE